MDENLSHLAKLKELHTLALCKANTATTGSGFQITGEGLQYVLFRLPKLKSLTLHAINGLKFNLSTALTPPKDDNGLISLKENRRKKSKMQIDHPLKQLRLQTLKLPFSLNFPLSEVALEQLQSVTYLSLQESYLLRRRDLNSTDVTRIFKRLHNVRKLDLSCSNCQNVVLSNLPPGVEWLELRDCYSVSVLGIHSLSRSVGSNLKYLGLSFCNRLSASLVSAFDKLFPKLEGLDLSCCRSVGDVHVKTFNNMKRLTYLRLVGCTKLSEESVKIARIESANRLFIIGPKYVNNYKK
uniref:Uncharacterized protein LOC102807012 n=1 Tax=Saccoglossus kowalevskii TaxID=10224 RepID=A0ABM0MXW9_SACKO|nr:PREDICTED: uncharacterized protein LOC102807012 [Saccoglossus kowalevskii]